MDMERSWSILATNGPAFPSVIGQGKSELGQEKKRVKAERLAWNDP
jgi:hypothetical protein